MSFYHVLLKPFQSIQPLCFPSILEPKQYVSIHLKKSTAKCLYRNQNLQICWSSLDCFFFSCLNSPTQRSTSRKLMLQLSFHEVRQLLSCVQWCSLRDKIVFTPKNLDEYLALQAKKLYVPSRFLMIFRYCHIYLRFQTKLKAFT